MIKKHIATRSRYRYGGGSSYSKRSRYRYGGSGIFDNIGRKLLGDNVKNLINTISKSKIAQKATNVVLEGARKAAVNQAQKGIEELATNAISNIKKKKKQISKEYQDIVNTVKQGLATNNSSSSSNSIPLASSIIGRGIVYD